MKYGYFDDARREYVVTRPDTPLPWINYLGVNEYCGLISNTAGGYSFFRDLRWHVQTKCWIGAESGNIYSSEWGGSVVQNEFYVHPWTGLLCWAEPIDRTRPDPPKTKVDLKDGKSYEKIDGIWYYLEEYDIEHEGLTLAAQAPAYLRPKILVEIEGIEFYRTRWTEHVSTKRQLNKKELRVNGLHNGGSPFNWTRCVKCGADGKCVHAVKGEGKS